MIPHSYNPCGAIKNDRFVFIEIVWTFAICKYHVADQVECTELGVKLLLNTKEKQLLNRLAGHQQLYYLYPVLAYLNHLWFAWRNQSKTKPSILFPWINRLDRSRRPRTPIPTRYLSLNTCCPFHESRLYIPNDDVDSQRLPSHKYRQLKVEEKLTAPPRS